MVADGLSALGLYITALQQGSAHAARGAAAGAAALRPGRARGRRPNRMRAHRHRLAARHRRAEAEGPGPLRGLEGSARRRRSARQARACRGRAAARCGGGLRCGGGAAERDRARCDQADVRPRPDRRLPRHPGPRARQAAPRPRPRRWCSSSMRPAPKSTRELLEHLPRGGERGRRRPSATTSRVCRDAPHDREALTTIRRGFHTLKGSGRMVGLTELGEVAWQCEQVMNKWLKDEKPATPQLLAFIELAQDVVLGLDRRAQGERRRAHRRRGDHARAELLKSDHRRRRRGRAGTRGRSSPKRRRRVEAARAAALAESRCPTAEARRGTAPSRDAPLEAPRSLRSLDAGRPSRARGRARRSDARRRAAGRVRRRAAPRSPSAEPPPSPLSSRCRARRSPSRTGARSRRRRARRDRKPARAPRRRSPTSSSARSCIAPALFAIYIGEAEQHVEALDREMAAHRGRSAWSR